MRAWLNDQAAETLYLSSVTLAELLFGIGALPAGKRKDMLAQALDGLMGLFRDRVLPLCPLRSYKHEMSCLRCGGTSP